MSPQPLNKRSRCSEASNFGKRLNMTRSAFHESEASSSSEDESEDGEDRWQESNISGDLPPEYWHIQKLVKYMKAGNQTATIISLCVLRDFNLNLETSQLAIRDAGGIEILINILETDDLKCRIGALQVLREISAHREVRYSVTALDGIPLLVATLSDMTRQLRQLAADTIANVARFKLARRLVRRHGGIPRLVDLMDVDSTCLVTGEFFSRDQQRQIEVARSGAAALWTLCKSQKNQVALRQAGGVPLLAQLLSTTNAELVVPVAATVQECSSEPGFQVAVQTEGMISNLVRHLGTENQELQTHCAAAIFKCAEDAAVRTAVRQHGGLDPLVLLLRDTVARKNKRLLAAVTGAVWKCAISSDNVRRLEELGTLELLVELLQEEHEEVLTNVVGAIGECCKDKSNRVLVRKAGGVAALVALLSGTSAPLLENVAKAVGECAKDTESMKQLEDLDGVRLLWSLLKNPSPKVQSAAAWSLCPCIEFAKHSGELVRSFVGGLELVVSLLKSTDLAVLANICAAVAKIAQDRENLAVITDHGVVIMLSKLVISTDDRLRRHLAEAIAHCCQWGTNSREFGRLGAVAPLVSFLESEDELVHQATAQALNQLSKDPANCITMHQSGVVPYLLKMIGSKDELLQEASAGCLGNIRRLALTAEKQQYQHL